jgi:hypothetical protein
VTLRSLALASLTLALTAGTAVADEERFSFELRGGVLNREDGGYADHAEVHGLSNPEIGGGGIIEGGVRFLPRLWVLASWSGFSSSGSRRLSELSVMNQAILGHLGFTAFRRELDIEGFPWSLRVDLTAGAGLYTIADELDGERSSDRGPGARVGAQVAFGWKAVGFAICYGWHMTGVKLEDRVGGDLGAGGHELGAGLRLQF